MANFNFNRKYLTYSPIIRKNLKGIIKLGLPSLFKANDECFVGWGLKKTGKAAKRMAKKRGGELVILEDGFLRSVGLGKHGSPCHSYCFDSKTTHFDGFQFSDLTGFLNSDEGVSQVDRDVASESIRSIINLKLSKYNHAPMVSDQGLMGGDNVLVVSQVKGDMSLQHGCDESDLKVNIVAKAIEENPGSRIFVKVHPDVICGLREADIDLNSLPSTVGIISDDYNPISLLSHFNKVYVRTSLMGFEALMMGKEVVCFGAPFYSGWGLTDDRSKLNDIREQTRSLEEVFYAAYIRNSFYVEPNTKEIVDLKTTIETLAEKREEKPVLNKIRYHFIGSKVYMLGFSAWKREYLKQYFPHDELVFLDSKVYQRMGWEFSLKKQVEELVEKEGLVKVRVWGAKFQWLESMRGDLRSLERVEDGFIRSIGLGSNKTVPASLIVDDKGIYFDPRKPSRLSNLLASAPSELTLQDCEQANRLLKTLKQQKLSKYNLGKSNPLRLNVSEDKKVVLVVGQVDDDASMLLGAPGLSNKTLIEAVRTTNPDSYIIYKPHPDVLEGKRKGLLKPSELEGLVDFVADEHGVWDVLAVSDEIHVNTSLVGLEALWLDKKVVCHGRPFYSGWGLTYDLLHTSGRGVVLTTEQMAACVLIKYPLYLNLNSGSLCSPEEAVEVLISQSEELQAKSLALHSMLPERSVA